MCSLKVYGQFLESVESVKTGCKMTGNQLLELFILVCVTFFVYSLVVILMVRHGLIQTPDSRNEDDVMDSGWIYCKDRLPEEGAWGMYIISFFGAMHGEKYVSMGTYENDGCGNMHWLILGKNRVYVYAWQPLPEPANEQR